MITQPALRAETELRLVAERQLRSNTGRHRGRSGPPSLGDIASALVVLADLPLATAQAVLDEYSAAASLRGIGPPPYFRRARQQAAQQQPPRPLTLPVVFLVDAVHDGAQVRSVVLSDDHARISVTYDGAPPWMTGAPSTPRGRRSAQPGLMPGQLRVADDKGTISEAYFNGGGGDSRWEGSWVTREPLSPTTRWIELDGTRLVLPDPAPPATVRVEPLEVTRLTHHFLWQRLALREHHEESADLLLDVLARLGLIDLDDEEDAAALETIRQVSNARIGRAKLPASPSGVPPEWRDLLTGRHRPGPQGAIAVPAVTPNFDGIQVVTYELRSDHDAFSIEAKATGVTASHHPMFDDAVVTGTLAWWAGDDRGNSYLGHWNSHSSHQGEISGTVRFQPALDRRATTLELRPTSLRSRAVITVPLSSWSLR